MMNTVLLAAAIAAIPGAAVGFLLGRLAGQEIVGTVAGFLIGASLGAYWVTRRRRWIVTVALIMLLALSFVTGGWFGGAYALAVSGITFFISASILRELYGGSVLRALSHHLSLFSTPNSGAGQHEATP